MNKDNGILNRNTLIIGADEEDAAEQSSGFNHHNSVAIQRILNNNHFTVNIGCDTKKDSFNEEPTSKEHRKEDDFLFGSISAAKH
jgi:hypothetical protein